MNVFHHLFIPSETNNFRSKLVHIDFLSVYVVFALVLTVLYKGPLAPHIGRVLAVATDISENALCQFTNQKRTENGLAALNCNQSQLADGARRKAKYMCDNNLWAHYGKDGTTPWSFISAAGYRYQYAGENLAQNFPTSDAVVNAWMASPSHKQNILNGNYTDMGFAVTNCTLNGQETTLVVQMFGRPQTTRPIIRRAAAQTRGEETTAVQKPVPTIAVAQTKTPAEKKPAVSKKASSLPLTSTMLLFSLLFVAFAFDLYFAYKLRLVRVSGKHAAHFIFIGFILASLIIISKGVIL